MSYIDECREYQKKIHEEMDVLLIHYTNEELEKRFLKNFGCINFISDEACHELDLAREFHKRHKVLHPAQHTMTESTPMNCYHVSKCTCGFSEECDSSG